MAAGSLFAIMQSMAMTGAFSAIGGVFIGGGLFKFTADSGILESIKGSSKSIKDFSKSIMCSCLLKLIMGFGGFGGPAGAAPTGTR